MLLTFLSPSFLPICVKVKLQLNSNKVALCLEDVNILHKLKHFITQITSLDGFYLQQSRLKTSLQWSLALV